MSRTCLTNSRKGRVLSLRHPTPRRIYKITSSLWSLVFSLLFFAGCAQAPGNVGNLQSYSIPPAEAQWIRDGEPLEFEGDRWYPEDGTENFLDSEVYVLGEYRGVEFFVDKVDVRPYDRLYTKFGKNRFRYFERFHGP